MHLGWGPDACENVSGFCPDVPGAWSFLRRLFLEADALPFVELVEFTGFDGAAMEEPLLSAIVPNESEPPIPDQTLDSSVRHVDNLRRPQARGPAYGLTISIPAP